MHDGHEREYIDRRNAILDKVSEHAYAYTPIKARMLHCSLDILLGNWQEGGRVR